MDYKAAPTTKLDSLKERIHKLDIGWGIDAIANVSAKTQFVLPEAYVKFRYRPFEFYVGRRREVFGLGGGLPLSSGSFAWSGNALPLTKVQLAIPEFWAANSPVSVKGTLAHGWFDNGFVTNSFLHQKSLYIRLGKTTGRVSLYGGFNHHQVQWAGTTERLPREFIEGAGFPSSLQAYWWVVSGSSLNKETDIDTTKFSNFDRGNRVGNHLGTVDVGAEIRFKNASLLLYRQSYYEDGSLFYMINIADGLNGMRLRNTKNKRATGLSINELTVEYLNTFSQAGGIFVDEDPKQRGREDYFNHWQYRDGWSYNGRTIGTPFIAPATDLRDDLPPYSFYNNNRVRVVHVGLSGQIGSGVTFMLKASYSQNAGTYQVPFSPMREQRSAIATAGFRLGGKGLRPTTSAAIDRGNLYTTNTGFSIGLAKAGIL